MLEYGQNDVLFRIIRRGYGVAAGGAHETHDTIEGFYLPDGPAADLQKWRRAAEFRVDRTYNTMLEIISVQSNCNKRRRLHPNRGNSQHRRGGHSR